ncbi:MAG: alpha/beta hydrolase, partial [Sphingomonadales bacterium]|nr:alpha/beta hydrolase [Sphingomonadales bacterium]
MWHLTAPRLAEHFHVVCMDLRGYGDSSKPESAPDHYMYSKRAMAQDVIDIADQLGHTRFLLCGHDRGGRVAYRLALDHPGRVEKLVALDIVPTYEMWNRMTRDLAMRTFHWPFLAQPAPWPEEIIGRDPVAYADVSIAARGLFALEILLQDPEFSDYGLADYTCALVQTVAADLSGQADALAAGWDAFAPTSFDPGRRGTPPT